VPDSVRISPTEPVYALRRIPIRECGEPLVNYLELCPLLIHDQPVFDYHRETLLRKGVAERLCQAAEHLPKGIRLAILEGWRGLHIQRRMYRRSWEWWQQRHPEWSETTLKRVVNRLTAPPNHPRVPPPHLTGGALDVGLVREDGTPLDLVSPYERLDPRSFVSDAPLLDDEARANRELLRKTLEAVGITNYPSEYWHFSYGDQGWAYRGQHPAAIYGPIEPPNWRPDPRDDIEAPVRRIDR